MSLRATMWAWSLDLLPTVKMVLLAIADKHNATTGDCYPSHALLVKMTGLSLSAVKIAIRKLDSMGVLSRSERSCHRSGRTVGVVYSLAITDAPRRDVDGEGARADHHEEAPDNRPYNEQEKEQVLEPEARKARDQNGFVGSMERERDYRSMRSRKSRFKSGAGRLLEQMYWEDRQAERSQYKSGALQLLEEMHRQEQANSPFGPEKRFKSGAAQRLQEIDEEERAERESVVVVDADYWTQEDM